MPQILTPFQEKFLKFLSKSSLIKELYWGGGTALSAIYFQHRLSTDIDCFSSDLIDPLKLNIFIKDLRESLCIKEIRNQTSMNRSLFWIDGLKFEIVYFPFPSLGVFTDFNGLRVDSLEDIATNKALALYQRSDPKDVIDLYLLDKRAGFSLEDLAKKVEEKFGEQLDLGRLYAKLFQESQKLSILEPLVFEKSLVKDAQNYSKTQAELYLKKSLL